MYGHTLLSAASARLSTRIIKAPRRFTRPLGITLTLLNSLMFDSASGRMLLFFNMLMVLLSSTIAHTIRYHTPSGGEGPREQIHGMC